MGAYTRSKPVDVRKRQVRLPQSNGKHVTNDIKQSFNALSDKSLRNGRVKERQALPVHSILPRKAPGKNLLRSYTIRFQTGLILSLLVLISATRIAFEVESEVPITFTEQEFVQFEEVLQTKQQLVAPPPQRPPVPISVPDDEIIPDVELDLDVSLDIDEIILDLAPPDLPMPAVEEKEEEEIFLIVEEMPEIVGGVAQLYGYVNYPDFAKKAGLEGTVVVGVVIESDGSPGEVFIVKSVHRVLDEESMAAVKKLTFEPGRQRGKAVRVKMSIPIRFRLEVGA